MRTDRATTCQVRTVHALVATVAMLAVGARALAQEVAVADESAAEISARAEASAGELATSVRSLESSLRSAAPVAERGEVLSADQYSALVEAGAKKQLAGLANELDQLSAALASGADPAGEKALLESIAQRAGALSQLGAGPARVPIPPELQAELVALWNDVRTLSAVRPSAAAEVPAEDAQLETAP